LQFASRPGQAALKVFTGFRLRLRI